MIEAKNCLHAISQGSEEALTQLYSHYADRVYNTMISYTKNSEDAEELLQDVFITIFNKASSFQFNSSVGTWIYRIAVNKSLNFIRKKNSQKRIGTFTSLYAEDSVKIKFEPTDFMHPGLKLECKEGEKSLFQAVERLPDNQKTAFVLTQMEGQSQKEAASLMRRSRKSVESLVQRAKASLRDELKKDYPERGD